MKAPTSVCESSSGLCWASSVGTFHLPIHRTAERLLRDGYPVFPVFGLSAGIESAHVFRQAVEQARQSHGAWGACLHLYDVREYAAMRLFVDAELQAGFALNGTELVSVFSHRNRRERHASPNLMAVATAIGGNRLNAFDTILPQLYGKCGFHPIARLPWNDEAAPKDWDYCVTGTYNGGRPDVVFMVHIHHCPSVVHVASFADGLAHQLEAIGGRI